MMGDLRNPRLMYLKAILFVLIGLVAAALILLDSLTFRTAGLLLLTVWAFCRAYYFAFYVIERYVDPSFKFSGLLSLGRYLCRRRK